jgi:uncharacterized membrane protein
MPGPRAALLLLLSLIVRLWLPLGSAGAAETTASSPTSGSDGDGVHILTVSCLKCHGETRQKGNLRLDSRASALLGGKSGPALIPGDAQHSLIMQAVRYDDPDLQMPPDEPLPGAQVSTLASWIAAGAPWADAAQDPGTGPATASAMSPPRTAHPEHPAHKRPPLIGRVHPIIVHFPIACLLLAVLAEFLYVTGGPKWDPLVRFLVVCGTLGALVAVVTGTYFAPEGTLFHHDDPLLTRHEFVGWLTLILALTSSALLFSSQRPRMRLIFRLVLLLTALLAGLTGHLGGSMVYGEHFLF